MKTPTFKANKYGLIKVPILKVEKIGWFFQPSKIIQNLDTNNIKDSQVKF